VKVVWRHGALASARRFMADQAGMRAINQAVARLVDHPQPTDAFVRSNYRRLRVGSYRMLYEVEADVVTIVRVDKVP
jgi:mRNA-degrading endonuclease RelE of RelBE toxin-antitoxin system